MQVRPARPGDEAALAALADQLGYPSTPGELRRRLAAMDDAGVYFFRVAETPAGEVAGWISACIARNPERDPVPEITGLVVDEGRRSGGIGRALLEAAEAWARGLGYTAMTVRSNVIRTRAHAFYQRQGYAIVKTQHAFRKPL